MSISADLLTYARKLNNYIVNATDNAAGNEKWDSTTAQVYTVPAAKRWFLLQSQVTLDVSGTCVVYARDITDKAFALLANYSAGTGAKGYPDEELVHAGGPVILDAGEDIQIALGVAQGAGAKATCVVLEVDV